MTDGPNNPNDLPDEDWAMSEPEVPTDPEPKPKPIDEVAAKLYAPPDTGDLQEWDIATNQVESRETPDGDPVSLEPPAYDGPAPFEPPQFAFEILKPLEITDKTDHDWGMEAAANDGWIMPKPVFRGSGGNTHRMQNEAESAAEVSHSEPVPETLAEIYAPPESEELITSEIDPNSIETEFSDNVELDFSSSSPVPSETIDDTLQPAGEKPKSKSWSLLLWILLICLLVFSLLAVGVFAVFFYSARH